MLDNFAAIADPTRREIISMLAERERTVNEIAAAFEISRPAISKHLRVLRAAGLVVEEKQGRQHIQRFTGAALQPVANWVNTYEAFWDRKLAALKSQIEQAEDDQ